MATAYGGRGDQFPFELTTTGVDISAADGDNQVFTVPTGWEGYIDLNKCLTLCTTTVVNTTPDGTITIKHGSTVIGTYSITGSEAANSMFVFTPASGYEAGVNLSAGDTFTIAHTQDTGTSVAGVFSVFMAVYMAPLAR